MSLESPNYYNSDDRALHDKLFYHNNDGKPLTEQEEEFVKDFVKIQDNLFFENIPIEKLVLLRDRINTEIDKRKIKIFGKDRP